MGREGAGAKMFANVAGHTLLATQNEIVVCSQPVIYETDLNLLLREGMS